MVDGILVFMLAGQRMALPRPSVREILPLPRLRRRPGLPATVAGFFALGAATLPVLDLAALLGLRDPRLQGGASHLEAAGLYRHLVRLDRLTLLVDRALDFADAPEASADGSPDGPGDPWQHGCVMRRLTVQGEPVCLLDPEKILLHDERARLDALTEAEAARVRAWDANDAAIHAR